MTVATEQTERQPDTMTAACPSSNEPDNEETATGNDTKREEEVDNNNITNDAIMKAGETTGNEGDNTAHGETPMTITHSDGDADTSNKDKQQQQETSTNAADKDENSENIKSTMSSATRSSRVTDALYRANPVPLSSREETVRMVKALVGEKVAVATAPSSASGGNKRGGSKHSKTKSTSSKRSKVSTTTTASRFSRTAATSNTDDVHLDVEDEEQEEGEDEHRVQGKSPLKEKDFNDTVETRPPLSNVFGDGPFLISDIPPSCLDGAIDVGNNNNSNNNNSNNSIVLGIDEAGRGSVLGPMVYGCAYWNTSDLATIPKDFNDSKQLSEHQREVLFETILKTPTIGFVARILHASEISRNMFRNYNLNQMSHTAAVDMIRHLLRHNVNISHCYVDTVGNADTYQRYLEKQFPAVSFTVESKADAKYPPCSAASVVAKVVRDRMIGHWKYSEDPYLEATKHFGSGYPSDPTCQQWLDRHLGCPVFGFPDVVRFSWGPVKKALQGDDSSGTNTRNHRNNKAGASGTGAATRAARAVSVRFLADQDDEDEEEQYSLQKQREQMSAFLAKATANKSKNNGNGNSNNNGKRKLYPYFERHGFEIVTNI